jgi:uncharacterized membrane protein
VHRRWYTSRQYRSSYGSIPGNGLGMRHSLDGAQYNIAPPANADAGRRYETAAAPMHDWSIDTARQSGWDLWVGLCAAASLVLIAYAVLGRTWATARGRATLVLAAIGVGGTLVVVAAPPLHDGRVGLVWTFALLSLLSAAFYLNLREQLSIGRTSVLLAMRVAALAVLVPMLFEPVARYVSKPKPERPLLFLVDTSGSMSIPDAANGPTRIQSVWQALRPELPTIAEHFVPSYFTFDTGFKVLDKPDDLARVQADGQSTDVVNGVSQALTRAARDDAAIVLISDGIDNVSPNAADAIRGAAHPIHTVRVGSDQATPANVINVAVDDVSAPEDFAVNHETPITATIRSTGLAGRVVEVKMAELDGAGKPTGDVKSQRLVLQPTADGQTVTLPFKPTTVGLHTVRVWIDEIPGERNTADNHQTFQGLAIDPRIKVLYVEGTPGSEYKFTRLAFVRDANVELATFLLTTPPGTIRAGVSGAETAGTVDGTPFHHLPVTPAEWARFDVVVVGDTDSHSFTPAQQQQLERRTADGGGLLMLGGHDAFAAGGYAGTPLERALPVTVEPGGQDTDRFVPRLTAAGVGSPILDGLGDWFGVGDRPGVKQLPPLNGNVVVGKPKSGAEVLMVHQDKTGPDGQPQVVLATQRYGKGRSAAFTVDTTYLWFLPLRGMGQDSPYNKLWGQLVRWLAGQDVRDRGRGAGLTALLNKSTYKLGESVKVRAQVRDEKGDATKYAQVSLTLAGQGDKSDAYALSPVESQPGMYQLVVPDPTKGHHSAEVIATKDGKELGRQTVTFDVLPPADEMTNVAANPQLLTSIANQTHGYHYDLGQFPQLIDQLIRSDPKTGTLQQRAVPLDDFVRAAGAAFGADPKPSTYDLPIQGLLMVGLLVAEWFLRRRWQLP